MKNEITTNQQSKTNFAISKKTEIKKAISQEVKIRDLDNDEPIKQVLRYIFALVGLKPDQIPGDIEKAVLLNFIRENFKGYSPNEFKIAFELALKGEFKTELNHFGSFSALYMSRIIGDYFEYRRKIVKEMNLEEEKRKKEALEEYERRPEVIAKREKEFDENVILKIFEEFQEKSKIDTGFIPVHVIYNTLKIRHGFFDKEKNFPNEEREKIIKEAQTRTKSEIAHKLTRFGTKQDDDFRRKMKNAVTREETDRQIFTKHCQTLAIEKLFQRIIDQKKHLKTYLK